MTLILLTTVAPDQLANDAAAAELHSVAALRQVSGQFSGTHAG
jgi:hypothetical protein